MYDARAAPCSGTCLPCLSRSFPEVRGTAAPPDPPWLAELAQRVDVYGRFDANLDFSGEDVHVANNGSRFGMKAEQWMSGKRRCSAKVSGA